MFSFISLEKSCEESGRGLELSITTATTGFKNSLNSDIFPVSLTLNLTLFEFKFTLDSTLNVA